MQVDYNAIVCLTLAIDAVVNATLRPISPLEGEGTSCTVPWIRIGVGWDWHGKFRPPPPSPGVLTSNFRFHSESLYLLRCRCRRIDLNAPNTFSFTHLFELNAQWMHTVCASKRLPWISLLVNTSKCFILDSYIHCYYTHFLCTVKYIFSAFGTVYSRIYSALRIKFHPSLWGCELILYTSFSLMRSYCFCRWRKDFSPHKSFHRHSRVFCMLMLDPYHQVLSKIWTMDLPSLCFVLR